MRNVKCQINHAVVFYQQIIINGYVKAKDEEANGCILRAGLTNRAEGGIG